MGTQIFSGHKVWGRGSWPSWGLPGYMTSFPWKVASQARSHSIAMSGPGHTGMLRYWSMGPFQDAATAQMSKVLISQRGENLNVIFFYLDFCSFNLFFYQPCKRFTLYFLRIIHLNTVLRNWVSVRERSVTAIWFESSHWDTKMCY